MRTISYPNLNQASKSSFNMARLKLRARNRSFVDSVEFPAWVVVLGALITGLMILMGALWEGR